MSSIPALEQKFELEGKQVEGDEKILADLGVQKMSKVELIWKFYEF